MFNPDIGYGFNNESPEIKVSPDRKEKLDRLCEKLHTKAGYGVTRIGDRLTIREHDSSGKYYEIQLVVLEVKLKRDFDLEEKEYITV